jgi:hypothetical protein
MVALGILMPLTVLSVWLPASSRGAASLAS